ncbi:hypothetical protein SDRG_08419 [Saprolegnia diclina VS20]|uniref:Calcium release-activated calcium channel protein 1 n=1 Tax=Saprolegnia diclina (strain VS20) TaxID=1156394 RepID=T0QHJ2_SAPDV|nr:hypothetical protein SDRG_08419 [Saprolegnia diclina VS20]EQC34216.1 hypothetical protein SDRG_08419 [Saprolegnia diclina VS20]|eukprot:XP_008612528.1 hypothetical protein SDRG_08419 [Saprolegnia diclina VS20]
MESIMENLIGSYDQRNAKAWRDEDMTQRSQELQWRQDDLRRENEWRIEDIRRLRIQAKLENERRQADTRAEQLSAISELGALLGGFALVSIINVNVPEDIDLTLLAVYGCVSALTICCMVISLIMCAILLLAVTRYSAHELEYDVRILKDEEIDMDSPFHIWWLKKCETDWSLGYLLFRTGVTLFLIELAVVSWVQYNLYQTTSISISIVAAIGILIWQFRILSRWRYLMKLPAIEVHGPIDITVTAASPRRAH